MKYLWEVIEVTVVYLGAFAFLPLIIVGVLAYRFLGRITGFRIPFGAALLSKKERIHYRCPHCRAIVNAGNAICPHCLGDLKENCPHCERIVRIGARKETKCPQCGKIIKKN